MFANYTRSLQCNSLLDDPRYTRQKIEGSAHKYYLQKIASRSCFVNHLLSVSLSLVDKAVRRLNTLGPFTIH